MGCLPVSASQITQGTSMGGMVVAAKVLCMKYQEKSQKECAAFEAKLKLETIEWQALVGAIATEKNDIAQIFDKAGLKAPYADDTTKLKEFVGIAVKCFEGFAQEEALKFLAVLMCKGKNEEKMESLIKGWVPAPDSKDIPGDKLEAVLIGVLKLAAQEIPKLTKVETKDYPADPKTLLYTWWRGSLQGAVPKERLKRWFAADKFTLAEARDAAFRFEVQPIPPGEDEFVQGGLTETALSKGRAEGISQVVLRLCNKKGIPKTMAELEAAIRLEGAGWDSVADAAEYCKGPMNRQQLLKFVRLGGLGIDYTDFECKLSQFLDIVTRELEDPVLELAVLAAFLCKGDPLEKARGLWLRLHHWQAGQKELSAEEWRKVLEWAMKLAVVHLPELAGLTTEFAAANVSELAQRWWGQPLIGTVKKEDVEKWFFPSCKFLPCQARDFFLSPTGS